MQGKHDLTGKTFLSQLLTVSHAEPGADPPRAGGIAWQIRNRDLNALSAPVRAREVLNKDPLGGLTGPEFCRFRNALPSYEHCVLCIWD